MRLRTPLLQIALALSVVAPVAAQEADPIAALLDQPPPAPEPAPPPPSYIPPPASPELTAPTYVDDTGRSPEAAPSPVELSYEARLRSSSASAQGLQGPMDGAWTLRGGEGTALYSLQLVDNGLEPLEGAWRDPRRRGSTDSSGFLSAIQRTGGELIASFYPRPGAGVATLVLNAAADGTWVGQLEEGGQRRPVVLRRD
ncbi:MAG: hypothetical protein Q8Q88_24050 [Phenylobacterium sp.]|uniref:hypothetical protein n=1 Tax=Phenylobacterium sp. TaxID=1871053 RepID=UPI0027375896|nr:hypothetical protein [Phenylobacterium sp.]MDP3750110.1 hypothetical protein [Phenylobacterium sp.]